MKSKWPMPIVTLCCALLLAGCGQKGPLYLPDQATDVVTRPTQTPAPAPGDAPNTPATVDSPEAPPNPAPEVTAPAAEDKDKKEPGAPTPR